MGKSFLCKIGIHSYKRPLRSIWGASSNIITWKKVCKRCSKKKEWSEPRPPPRYD